MVKRILGAVFIALLAVVSLGSPVFAEVKLQGGMLFELKHEFWKNIFDMNNHLLDNKNFFYIITAPWVKADVDKDISIYARLLNETKVYTYYAPSSTKTYGKDKKGYPFKFDEVIFDNLYLEVRKLFGLPVTMRFGRQDFVGQYGEGFLLFEGTPGDGMRTGYFNAAKFSWEPNAENNVDFIYINNPRDDQYLPVFNEVKGKQALNTTDEQGYVLYWKNKSIDKLAMENYYIYKIEAAKGGTGLQGEKGRINALGSFLKYDLSPWTFRGQFAYQFGSYGENDRQGYGGYFHVGRDFKEVLWKPHFTAGFIYLSGDKQGTDRQEAWDPLFSRWAWISESYVLSMAMDTGVAGYWTNLKGPRLGMILHPARKVRLLSWYNYFMANEQVAESALCSGTGKSRGHLFTVMAEYAMNKNIFMYAVAEYMMPGDFYKGKDPLVFTRADITFKF